MFGQNQIVGRRHFKEMPPNSLEITSIFYTLQGEGPFMGRPAVFVRTAMCNLACSFCDTYFDAGDVMTFEQIRAKIDEVLLAHWESLGMEAPDWALKVDGSQSDRPFSHDGLLLVITGGEPALQTNLEQFLQEEYPYWYAIQIESNGTLDLHTLAQEATIVLSPKCAEVDGKPTHYLLPSQRNLSVASYLKFVVSADPESPYHSVPKWAVDWASDHCAADVFVSPMNVYQAQPMAIKIATMKEGVPSLELRSTVIEKVSFWEPGLLNLEANRANHEHAAKLCMQYGFNLNLQMHLYASLA